MARRAVSLKTKPSDKTVAIVEDEAVLSRVLEVKLKNAGFNTILAADGEEASKLIRDKRPDLVLLDLVMPKKDGFEVLREMRDSRATEDTPVMILSNHGSDEDRILGKKFGACSYLIKSTTKLNTVIDEVENILGCRTGNAPGVGASV
ncbi:MAG: response regulator [Patescibacteria group bacterium]|nr:response regulator [Patescibacteria group bacterium]